jgi:four helix bundle protein
MAMKMAETIYGITQTFPPSEQYGLTSQMRRAAVSVPSNIAEGCARRSELDKMRLLSIALGSIAELETQTELATRLGFIDTHSVLVEVSTVKAALLRLIGAIERQSR